MTIFEEILQDWSRQVETGRERFATVSDAISFTSERDPAIWGFFDLRESSSGGRTPSFRLVGTEPRCEVQCRFTGDSFTRLLSGESGLRDLWREGTVILKGTTPGIVSLHHFLHLLQVEPLNVPRKDV